MKRRPRQQHQRQQQKKRIAAGATASSWRQARDAKLAGDTEALPEWQFCSAHSCSLLLDFQSYALEGRAARPIELPNWQLSRQTRLLNGVAVLFRAPFTRGERVSIA